MPRSAKSKKMTKQFSRVAAGEAAARIRTAGSEVTSVRRIAG